MPGNRFIERLEQTSAEAETDDGCVRARCRPGEGTTVALRPDLLAGHDERSLSRQITAVIGRARAAFTRSLSLPYPARPAPAGGTAGRRRERYAEELAEVDVIVASGSDLVKARVTARRGLEVRVRPGALRRLDVGAQRLTGEINAAIAAATREYGRERGRLHRRWFSAVAPVDSKGAGS